MCHPQQLLNVLRIIARSCMECDPDHKRLSAVLTSVNANQDVKSKSARTAADDTEAGSGEDAVVAEENTDAENTEDAEVVAEENTDAENTANTDTSEDINVAIATEEDADIVVTVEDADGDEDVEIVVIVETEEPENTSEGAEETVSQEGDPDNGGGT